MQPDSTEPNVLGLSPQQEQAATLLVSGLSVQDVADRLGIHRSTLWHWRNLETFEAYFNRLRSDAQAQAVEAVTALHEKAVATMERLMEQGGDAAALKAATFVLEMTRNRYSGETDPREIVKSRQSEASMDALRDSVMRPDVSREYVQRCRDLGIKP